MKLLTMLALLISLIYASMSKEVWLMVLVGSFLNMALLSLLWKKGSIFSIGSIKNIWINGIVSLVIALAFAVTDGYHIVNDLFNGMIRWDLGYRPINITLLVLLLAILYKKMSRQLLVILMMIIAIPQKTLANELVQNVTKMSIVADSIKTIENGMEFTLAKAPFGCHKTLKDVPVVVTARINEQQLNLSLLFTSMLKMTNHCKNKILKTFQMDGVEVVGHSLEQKNTPLYVNYRIVEGGKLFKDLKALRPDYLTKYKAFAGVFLIIAMLLYLLEIKFIKIKEFLK
jgi:hypothetical protein